MATNRVRMPTQAGKDHFFSGYDTKERFCSYWTQIHAVLKLSLTPVLEVGVGNKLVNDHLKRHGVEVTSIDVVSELEPDVVASITDMPFEAAHFGTVMACQVLEHLPFDLLPVALSEMSRVTRRYAVISLPDASRSCAVSISLPKLGKKQRILDLSKIFPRGVLKAHKEHFWEIGRKGYPVERIVSTYEKAGFGTLDHYRVPEFPYHHFFILEKKGK